MHFKQSSDKLSVNKTVAVVSKITNSCVGQAVIVIIVVYPLSVNSGTKVVRTIKRFSETKHIFAFTEFAINELIFKRF